ncbi:MAG: hypothetical protein AB7O26_14890 [Planctomycetaceae bacterium]
MFRFITNILTAFAILAHSLFGCCTHSAEAHEVNGESLAAESREGCCSHSCSSPQNSSQVEQFTEEGTAPDHGDSHERKHCHDETCSFVCASLVKVSTPFEMSTFDMLPADAAAAMARSVLGRIARAAEGYRAGMPLTLRAQAWLGVWLV